MKKFIKITGIIILVFLMVFLAGYVWVIQNAQYLMHEFVKAESGGKIVLTSKQVKYSIRKHQFILINPRITSEETYDSSTSYIINLKRITLNTSSLKSILLRQRITIDSIDCDQPVVEVIKNRKLQEKKISLPDEIAKIYNTISETISKLRIRHLAIHTGSFSLIKKYEPDSAPIRISNIDLTISNLGENQGDGLDDRILFSDRILLQSSHQDIIFPDGFHGLRFSKFRMNTQTRQIEIDSCYIYGNRTSTFNGEFGIFVDTLRLLNTDLNALAKYDLIKVDSALCMNPVIAFNFEVRNSTRDRIFPAKKRIKDSLQASFKKLFANLDIQYIGVQNADIDFRVKRGERHTSYTSNKSNFNLHRLLIIDDPNKPIQLERFDFAIRNYIGYSPDSVYAIRFDSILLVKNKVSLSNFSIAPTGGDHNNDWKEVKMRAFELEDITWADLIYDNKIVADRAILVKPEVEIRSPKNASPKKRKKGSLYQALAGFKTNLEISRLLLNDAKVTIESGDGSLLELQNFNTTIQANNLLESDDAGELIKSIDGFSFGIGSLSNQGRKFDLVAGVYNGLDKSLLLGKAIFTGKSARTVISAENIVAADIERMASFQFRASVITWQKADIKIDQTGAEKNDNNSNTPFFASWQETRGQNTRLQFNNSSVKLNTFLSTLSTGQVNITDNDKPEIDNIRVEGKSLQLDNKILSATIGGYSVRDGQPSSLEDILLTIPGPKENIRLTIPKLTLDPDIKSLMNGRNKVNKIRVYQPVIHFEPGTGAFDSSGQILPAFSINRLEMIEPIIKRTGELMNTGLQPNIQPTSFIIENILSDQKEISAERFFIQMKAFSLLNEQFSVFTQPQTQNTIALSDIRIIPANREKKLSWSAMLDSADVPGIAINIKPDQGLEKNISAEKLQIKSVRIGTGRSLNHFKILGNNPDMKLSTGDFIFNNGKSTFRTIQVKLDNSKGYLESDSFSFSPNISRDSFMALQEFRKDYITATTGKILISDLRMDKFDADSILKFSRIDISNPSLHIYKDMHLPFRQGIIKPLPTGMIKHIKTKLEVDNIRLRNALIIYEELNDKTNKTGIAGFYNTEASIKNFRNTGASEGDSLTLNVSSRFLDTASLQMRFSESYTDTLHGFLMGLRIGQFGLPALNPLLEPLTSVRIDAGYLDTLNMRAVGREYLAWGKMQMYYTGLHVNFLNKKDIAKKTILTRLLNFTANAIIRKKNVRKTGTVYVERMREKSVFHYWMKIVLSGAMANAGIRGTNKSERKYHKQIRKLHVPEIGDVEID